MSESHEPLETQSVHPAPGSGEEVAERTFSTPRGRLTTGSARESASRVSELG
jgi:hypothetical protein